MAGSTAAAPASFMDAVGNSILASVDSLEAHIDVEGLVRKLAAEEKATSRNAARALSSLKELAKRAPGAVHATPGAVVAVLRALAKLSPRGGPEDEDDDAVEPLQDCIETLTILIGDAEPSKSNEVARLRGDDVAELVVRHTENCKSLLRLFSAKDVSTEYDAMVLVQRIYRRMPAPVISALKADPGSFGKLMSTLQTCHIDYVRNECLGLLILVTSSDKDIQTIVTVQGLVETIFQILEEEDLTTGSKVARDLLRCFMNLVSNATCQKYIRETGSLTSLVAAMSTSIVGRAADRSDDQDDDFVVSDHRANVPEEQRWLCLGLLVDAALALMGRCTDGSGGDFFSEVLANQNALVRAGILGLCRHLRDTEVAHVAKVKIVDVLELLVPNALAAQKLQVYHDDSPPLFVVAADVVLGPGARLSLRSALGRVLGRMLVQHPNLQSFVCSSLSPQLDERQGVSAPVGRQIVELLEAVESSGPSSELPAWFGLNLALAMLHGNPDIQSVCVSMPVAVPRDAGPPESFLELSLRALSACARSSRNEAAANDLHGASDSLAVEQAQGPESAAAVLLAMLKLLLYWLSVCPAALARFACSPVMLQLAVDLATSGKVFGTFFQVQVEGLASLLLGGCVCAQDSDVDVASLMALLAQKLGIEEFQRKAERLWRSEALQRPPRRLGDFRWYGSRFRAFVRERQHAIQRRMVQLYVAGSVGGVGVGGALSEDLADHYKQIIRVQDSELQTVRKENEQLRMEVDVFMSRALQAKSFAVADKVTALQQENVALHAEVEQLARDDAERQRRFELERHHLRSVISDMEQQLQSVAVGYEQLDSACEAATRENARLKCELDVERRYKDGAQSQELRDGLALERARLEAAELKAERDDLLQLLSLVNGACPEAAAFMAPIGLCTTAAR